MPNVKTAGRDFRIVRWIVSFFVLTVVIGNSRQCAATEVWKAGVAKAKITPAEPMWMAGYGGRNHPSEGTLTDLWAKVLVLQDAAGNRAVLITLDLVGIGPKTAAKICDLLKQRHGIERRQIALCTSHTHTGPALQDNLAPLHYLVVDANQQAAIERYTNSLPEKIAGAVAKALADLSPSRLAWANTTATFAVNRRNNRPESMVPQWRAEGQLKGPIDHDVPVLAAREMDGRLKAVVFGYACHATVLSFYQWSGDYPGFAQIELEKMHPDCQAMFWAGCGADQNPLPRRTVELAQQYGRELAAAVDKVLSAEMQPIASTLKSQLRFIDLPLAALPDRKEIEADVTSSNKFVAARAKMLLSQIDGGQPLQPTYPFPVQTWQLGPEIQFVTLGGEVVVDYAIRLKTEISGQKTWVAGYANDVMAYIASRRVLREGGYEGGGAMVYYGLPTVWSPEIENLIVDEVHRQLNAE